MRLPVLHDSLLCGAGVRDLSLEPEAMMFTVGRGGRENMSDITAAVWWFMGCPAITTADVVFGIACDIAPDVSVLALGLEGMIPALLDAELVDLQGGSACESWADSLSTPLMSVSTSCFFDGSFMLIHSAASAADLQVDPPLRNMEMWADSISGPLRSVSISRFLAASFVQIHHLENAGQIG